VTDGSSADAGAVERGNVAGARAVADQLSEAILAVEAVDLNLLLDDEVRTLLDAKQELQALCRHHRETQHGMERAPEQREGEP